jgi:hypothetical protein
MEHGANGTESGPTGPSPPVSPVSDNDGEEVDDNSLVSEFGDLDVGDLDVGDLDESDKNKTTYAPDLLKYPFPSGDKVFDLSRRMYEKQRFFSKNPAKLLQDHHDRKVFNDRPQAVARMCARKVIGNAERQLRLGRRTDPARHETHIQSGLSGLSAYNTSWEYAVLQRACEKQNKPVNIAITIAEKEAAGMFRLLGLNEESTRAIMRDRDEAVWNLKEAERESECADRIIGEQQVFLEKAQSKIQQLSNASPKGADTSEFSDDATNGPYTVHKELGQSLATIDSLMDKIERMESELLATRIDARSAENKIPALEVKNRLLETKNNDLQERHKDLLRAFTTREIDMKEDNGELKKALADLQREAHDDSAVQAQRLRDMDPDFVPVFRHRSVLQLLKEKTADLRQLNSLFEGSLKEFGSSDAELNQARDESKRLVQLLDAEKAKRLHAESQADEACRQLKEVKDERNGLFTELEYLRDVQYESEYEEPDPKVETLRESLKALEAAQAAHEEEIAAKDEELKYAYQYCKTIEAQHETRERISANRIGRLEADKEEIRVRLAKINRGSLETSQNLAADYAGMQEENLKLLNELTAVKIDKANQQTEASHQERVRKETELVSEIISLKFQVADLQAKSDSSESPDSADIAAMMHIRQYNAVQEERDAVREELEKARQDIASQKAANDALSDKVDTRQQMVVDTLKRLEEIACGNVDDYADPIDLASQFDALRTQMDVFKAELKDDILHASQVREEELPGTIYELLVLCLAENGESRKALEAQIAHYRELARSVDTKNKFAANRELELQKFLAALGKNTDWLLGSVKSMVAPKARGDTPAPRPATANNKEGSNKMVRGWLKSIGHKVSISSLTESKADVMTPAETVEETTQLGDSESPRNDDAALDIDQSWMGQFLTDSDEKSTATSETLVQEIVAGADTSALVCHLESK